MTPTWRVLRQAPVFTHLETLSSLLSLSFSYNLTSPAEAAVSRFEPFSLHAYLASGSVEHLHNMQHTGTVGIHDLRLHS